MAGFGTTKAEIDTRIGSLIVVIRDSLDAAVRVDTWFDEQTDTDLVNKGYSAAEITTMRAAFNALVDLRNIAIGQRTQPAVNDFLFDARKLTGLQ